MRHRPPGRNWPKTVTVTKGWSEAYGMFLDGEADMVLSYTTSPPIT
jgi:ABC-type thiamine transport system substrate-binding protein